jgi:hypothetical protein
MAIMAGVALIGWLVPVAAVADGGSVSTFNVTTTAAAVDFFVSYPRIALPFNVFGGILEATTIAQGIGHAQGIAGLAPVPILTSIGLIIPSSVPVLNIPIPQQIQDTLRAINYKAFPNYCESDYPALGGEPPQATCGGPNQANPSLAFTYAGLNGHTSSSGDQSNPLAAAAEAESTASDFNFVPMQLTLQHVTSKTSSGLNAKNLPQGLAEADVAGINLLGGTIQLSGVSSSTNATSDGTPAGTAVTTGFQVGKISVAGIPITVGPDGIAISSKQLQGTQFGKTALDVLSNTVNATLKALGITITFTPASVTVNGSTVDAKSAGIEIKNLTGPPLDANTSFRIGFTAVHLDAQPGGDTAAASTPAAGGDTSGSVGAAGATSGLDSSGGGTTDTGAGTSTPSGDASSPSLGALPSTGTSSSLAAPVLSARNPAVASGTLYGNKRLFSRIRGPLKIRNTMPYFLLLMVIGLLAAYPGRRFLACGKGGLRLP